MMKKTLFCFGMLICLLTSFAVPVLALDTLPKVSGTDDAVGNYRASTLDSGRTVDYSYTIPKDGAVVVICFSLSDTDCETLFSNLNRFNWVKSGCVEIIAIESSYASQAEVQTFMDTFAPDLLPYIQVYYGNSRIQWDYCAAMNANFISYPLVAVVTAENGVPTIRCYDIRVTDAETIYNSLCQVSQSFAAANPVELGETSGTYGGVSWKYEDKTGTLTISGKGAMPEDTYASEEHPWHHLRKRVRKVVVSEGVTGLGIRAFADMKHLTSVTLPQTLKVLPGSLFNGCSSLSSILLPEGLKEIGWSVFENCSALTSMKLPSTLEWLSFSAFRGTGITTITIPASVIWVTGDSFSGMEKLSNITVEKGNVVYKSVDGVLYSIDGASLLRCPEARSGTFTVPSGVQTISEGAFSNCKLLQTIEVADGVTLIDDYAFQGCTRLSSLILPPSLTTIGHTGISQTALKQLVIPASVILVDGNGLYNNPSLSQVLFLGDAPLVGDYPLAGCAETVTVYYPAGAKDWESTWGGVATKSFTYKLTSTASCTKAGTETVTSSAPQLNYTRQVRALGHDLAKWTLAKAATETAEGQWNRGCTRCAHTQSVVIPAFLPAQDHAASSYTLNAQNYDIYSSVIDSDLTVESDGFTRVEHYYGEIIIEKYDKSLNFVSQRKLSCELPIYGGYYTDGTYRFLVFGQRNPNDSNEVETFRIVRYSMDWQRMDSTSIYGANTYIPLYAGSLRMAHSGDYLYIRTAHEMYKSADGFHHQASVFLLIHIPTMKLVDQVTGVGGNGYVSHSFNQFIIIDGKTILTVDHGDAYPRSAVLIRYPVEAGKPYFHDAAYNRPEEVDTLTYIGEEGLNYTGATIGGFEASDTHYLIAGTTADQSQHHSARDLPNIYVTATSKTDFSFEGTAFRWITNYPADTKLKISTPHLVKLDSSRFLLMWMEDAVLRYTFLDGTGKVTGKIYSADAGLSDCRPVISGGKVIWYVTNNYEPVFYTIDPSNPAAVSKKTMEHIHTFGQWDCWWKPTATEEGRESRICACGESESRSVPPYTQWGNPFTDIKEGKYYYGPVLWAYHTEITTGKTATTFQPDTPCTRSQIVTFLWRAMGQPEPESMNNPFSDVAEGKYYTKAVMWAVQQGITTGKTATTFEPDSPCTRAQVVTFLWRTMGLPEPWNSYNPFWDVPENKYYTTAVLWALENGITTGKTANTFLPDDTCTRAQIVTFLYRTLVESSGF